MGKQGNPTRHDLLTDATGRTRQRHTLAAGTTTIQLNLSNLPAGMYLLRLTTPHATSLRRLIVQ